MEKEYKNNAADNVSEFEVLSSNGLEILTGINNYLTKAFKKVNSIRRIVSEANDTRNSGIKKILENPISSENELNLLGNKESKPTKSENLMEIRGIKKSSPGCKGHFRDIHNEAVHERSCKEGCFAEDKRNNKSVRDCSTPYNCSNRIAISEIKNKSCNECKDQKQTENLTVANPFILDNASNEKDVMNSLAMSQKSLSSISGRNYVNSDICDCLEGKKGIPLHIICHCFACRLSKVQSANRKQSFEIKESPTMAPEEIKADVDQSTNIKMSNQKLKNSKQEKYQNKKRRSSTNNFCNIGSNNDDIAAEKRIKKAIRKVNGYMDG